MALILGLVLGAIWHQLWLFPFPQLSQLRHRPSKEWEWDFLPSDQAAYYMRDSMAGHIHKPHVILEFAWPEHPQGSIRFVTNNLGFRKDSYTTECKGSGIYRILVTGDSHTDGVVYNSESFPNRLETMLNLSDKKLTYEVINGGIGYYGPHNYSGFLQRFMFLRPDIYVVVFYTGNDFLDGLRTAEIRKNISIPARPAGYQAALQKANSQSSGAMGQVFNQIYFFKTYPALTMNAVDIAAAELLAIHQLCEREGIGFIVLTLPTKCDIDRDLRSSTCGRVSDSLGLGQEDLEINKNMGRQLLERLNAQGIKTLDLLPAMQKNEEKLFWEKDYHLNHTGHALLAHIFFEHFGDSILHTLQ